MVVVEVERWRLRGYLSFCITVVTGIFLTKAFSGINEDNTLLTEVFGYNNICLYFDFPPSNYVLPLFWSITSVCMLVYALGAILRSRAAFLQGHLDRWWFKVFCTMKIFEISGLVFFCGIFAVSPEGWDHTLVIHTTPFLYLQFALVSLSVSNTIEGVKSGYWESLDLPSWFSRAHITYDCVFSIVVAVKVPWTTAMLAMGPIAIGSTPVARFFDFLFLIYAVVIPMLKTMFFVKFRATKLRVVHFIPTIRTGCEQSPIPLPGGSNHIPSSDLGFSTAFACAIIFLVFWNLAKLPFYIGFELPMTNTNFDSLRCQGKDPPLACSGMMTSQHLAAAIGFQGVKLLSDPQLFLGPHTVMGAILLSMILCVLRGWESIRRASYIFLPLSFIFAVHVLPVSHGVPSSRFGWNVNILVCSVVIVGCFVGGYALVVSSIHPATSERMLLAAWILISVMIFSAPALEWRGIVTVLGDRARNDGKWVVPKPDRPHEESGRDFFASWGCSWLGTCITIALILSVVPLVWLSRVSRVSQIHVLPCEEVEDLDEKGRPRKDCRVEDVD